MYTYKNIRKEFGLGQEDLALLLRVSRISIIRLEKGKAALNTDALATMATLEKCLVQEQLKPKTTNTAATASYCRELEADCLFRLTKLKRKLAAMQRKSDQVCHMRLLLAQLSTESDKYNEAWVKCQAFKVENAANKCKEEDLAAQLLLIMITSAELTVIRKYMQQHKMRPPKAGTPRQIKIKKSVQSLRAVRA